MIRALYRTQTGHIRTDLRLEEFTTALGDEGGLLWVDLADESPDVCAPILRDTFGFHPLAVDDALEQSHVPKVDDWGGYIYLVLHAVVFDLLHDESLTTLELDIFLGPNYLVTYQAKPLAAVDRVWTACQRDERYLQNGAAHLLYHVADELVADFLPAIERVDEAIDKIEDQVFDNPTPVMLESIFALKRALLHLRRIIAPQRETLNKLARGDYAVIGVDERIFFRDVYDHLVRLYDIAESLRDLVGSALDTYLSVVNNRMNEVMKTLTVITTLFLPITFLVGFFATNFFQPVAPINAFTDHPAFALFMVSMLVLPVGMFVWMRKRAWM